MSSTTLFEAGQNPDQPLPASSVPLPTDCSLVAHAGHILDIIDPDRVEEEICWVRYLIEGSFLAEMMNDEDYVPTSKPPLSWTPSTRKLVESLAHSEATTADKDTLWTFANILGVESWHFIEPVTGSASPHRDRSYYLCTPPPIVVCRDIEEVEETAGTEPFRKALEKPSLVLQMPITTQSMRWFLRGDDDDVDTLNRIASPLSCDVKHWAIFKIPDAVSRTSWPYPVDKIFVCPWPENQLPPVAGPTPFPGWTQRRYADHGFDEQTDAQCLQRFTQKLDTESANPQDAEQEELQFFGPPKDEPMLCSGK